MSISLEFQTFLYTSLITLGFFSIILGDCIMNILMYFLFYGLIAFIGILGAFFPHFVQRQTLKRLKKSMILNKFALFNNYFNSRAFVFQIRLIGIGTIVSFVYSLAVFMLKNI